jgi:hypothetical protein
MTVEVSTTKDATNMKFKSINIRGFVTLALFVVNEN